MVTFLRAAALRVVPFLAGFLVLALVFVDLRAVVDLASVRRVEDFFAVFFLAPDFVVAAFFAVFAFILLPHFKLGTEIVATLRIAIGAYQSRTCIASHDRKEQITFQYAIWQRSIPLQCSRACLSYFEY